MPVNACTIAAPATRLRKSTNGFSQIWHGMAQHSLLDSWSTAISRVSPTATAKPDLLFPKGHRGNTDGDYLPDGSARVPLFSSRRHVYLENRATGRRDSGMGNPQNMRHSLASRRNQRRLPERKMATRSHIPIAIAAMKVATPITG